MYRNMLEEVEKTKGSVSEKAYNSIVEDTNLLIDNLLREEARPVLPPNVRKERKPKYNQYE